MLKPTNQSTKLAPVQRAVRWLIDRQQSDSSLRGATSLADYYKCPFALTVSGYNFHAERVLDYICKTYLKDDGDLGDTGLSWFDNYRIYPHGWVAIAAIMRGRFDIAYSILRFLVAQHDSETGGFFTTAEAQARRVGTQDVLSNCLAGLACLWAGRLDIAEQIGEWLQRLYDAQPDVKKGLYCVWDSRSGLVRSFPREEAKAHFVDCSQLSQCYYQYGISAAFLSSLSAAKHEKRWLELAQKFLRASKHCREDVYRQGTGGKIGWGAAWTYRLSKDEEERQIVELVAEGLHALQNEDGSWSARDFYDRQPGIRYDSDYEETAEFIGLLGCMELILEQSPSSNHSHDQR